jgi:lia operon protein LiaG
VGASQMLREINEEKIYSMEKMNGIQIDMSSVPVHIIGTDNSSEVKVNFHGKAMQEIKLVSEVSNNTLVVKVQRKHEKLPIYEEVVLEVYIPKEYTKDLAIHTASSHVKMDYFKLASFTYHTASGKLDTEKLNAENIAINTSSGDVNLKELDAQKLDIKGLSSVIKIDECNIKEAKMETSSGNITLNNSSGNYDLKGSSGKIHVTYKEFENQNVTVTSSSGSVTLELPNTAEFLIEAKTTSGKFQSGFPINMTENSNKKNIEGRVGTKNNKILIHTVSGKINILNK